MEETRKQLLQAMGFSGKAVAILENQLNMGNMAEADIREQHQGRCGDILMLSLKIAHGFIKDARYEYIGCAGLQACASAMTELVKGMSVTEAAELNVDHILDYLEGIPQQKYECAEISRDTLHKALARLSKQS